MKTDTRTHIHSHTKTDIHFAISICKWHQNYYIFWVTLVKDPLIPKNEWVRKVKSETTRRV